MKIAISLPDQLFEEGERLAKRLKLSRSEVYARALADFVARNSPDAITEALDSACEGLSAESGIAREASRRTLGRSEW